MRYLGFKGVMLLCLASAGIQSAVAAELVWHSYEVVNVPKNYQFPVGSTSATIAGGGSVNAFPVADLVLGEPDYGLHAEVGVVKEAADTLALNTNARVKMASSPRYGGAWANANGHLTATFELVAEPGDPQALEKKITIDLTGTYANQTVSLVHPQGNEVGLAPGENLVTLQLGQVYTLKAFVYSVATYQGVEVEDIAAATLRIKISDKVICTVDATPSFDNGILNVNVNVGTSVDAILTTWLIVGSQATQLSSTELGPTEPPVVHQLSRTDPGLHGSVGILSTLSTAADGHICTDWKVVATQ